MTSATGSRRAWWWANTESPGATARLWIIQQATYASPMAKLP